MIRKHRTGTSAIVALMLMMAVFGGGALRQGAAQAQGNGPQLGRSASARPVAMDPATLPAGASAVVAPSEAHGFHTQDAAAFANAKQAAAATALNPSTARASDRAKPAAGGGPQLAGSEEAAAEGPGPLAPARSTTFIGLNEATLIPPDTSIAAGPSNLVEVVNARIAVYSKTTGAALVAPTTLQAWYGQAASTFLFDPVVIYRGGHFYVVTLLRNTTTQVSQILVSVSRTSSGSGAWCNYTLNGEQATTNWADFPRVGATQDKLLIATNQFTWANNSFQQNFLYELNKTQLDACVATGFSTWNNFTNSNGSLSFTLNPVLDYDASSTTYFQTVNALFPGGNTVTIWRRNIAAATWTRFDVGTQAYSLPPDARQPGTATRIATNDSRILSAMKRYDKMWVMQTTGVTPSGCSASISAVHSMRFNSTTVAAAPTLSHATIYHGGCTLDYYYPAATVDGDGNMLMIFNRSSTGERPNVRFTGWHAARFTNQTTLADGGGYFGSSGTVTPGAFTETRGRWGDYSGISIDPTGTQEYVWIAGEQLANNNSWTTLIARIYHSPVPFAP